MTSPQAARLQFWLRFWLRWMGTGALLAAPFILLPDLLLADIHRRLGMGDLPAAPVVGYLARSTSFFYAGLGALAWLVSFDLVRYRPIVKLIGIGGLLLGLMLLAVDTLSGMPRWWAWSEGPLDVAFGSIFLWCMRAVPRDAASR